MSILKVSTKQVKAARALLGWTQADLARNSKISEPTIKRLEAKPVDAFSGSEDTIKAVISTLEKSGVIFIDQNGEGPGVRLRK